MLFLLFSHCFPCRAAFLFLRFSYGSPVIFLWFSCDCPIVCLCFSLSLAVVSLCFSCGVLVVFLWLFLTFSIKNRSTNHHFGVPGASFWELFGALGTPWTLNVSKGVLEVVLGWIFDGF